MSIRTMTIVWDCGRYDAGALLVLLAMADYADEDHVCRPSIGALARKARLSDRQTIRILNQFKEDGVITPIGEYKARPGRPIVIYRINTDLLKDDIVSPLPTSKDDIVSPLKASKGDIDNGDLSPMSPLKVTSMSYDPSLEPSLDPRIDDDNNNNRASSSSSSSSSGAPVGDLALLEQPPPEQPPAPADPKPGAAHDPPPDGAPQPTYAQIAALYEQNFGLLTPLLTGSLKAAMQVWPPWWIEHAMRLAVQSEVRKWTYVEGILANWQREGFNQDGKRNRHQTNLPAASTAGRPGRTAAPDRRPAWADGQPARHELTDSEIEWAAELNGDDPATYRNGTCQRSA